MAPIEVRGDDFAACDVEIQNEAVEFEQNMPLTVFRKGDLIAFGGSDGYCFDIIELTNDTDSKKMTLLTKVKGNILTLYSKDEQNVVIFQREDQWEDGKMQFAHILRKEKDQMVQVNNKICCRKRNLLYSQQSWI